MPNKPFGSAQLATIAPWLIAALCLGLCALAIVLWQTDLSIRQRLPELGYNEILKLREDAWRPFRAPLAWALTVISVGVAIVGGFAAFLVRRLMTLIPAAIAAVVSLGTLGYLVGTQ